MQTFLIAVVILFAVWLILRRLNPAVVVVSNTPLPSVGATTELRDGVLFCTLTLANASAPHFVTSLDAKRSEAEPLGVGVPESFRIERLPDSGSDPEWVARWNEEHVRFVGRLTLAPEVPTVLRVPAHRGDGGPISFKGQFENGRKFMGSISFFYIRHPQPNTEAQA